MGDIISRQAAIDYFVTNIGWHDEDGYSVEDAEEIRRIWTEIFNGVPSAEPQERKTGRWEDGHRYGYNGVYWFIYCSECMYERDDDNHEKDTPFCQNCGASMEVEHETD